LLARPLAALLAIALPIQAVPLNPAIRKAVPEANAAGDGGSGHGSRSRRERALFVRVELVVVALSREKDQAGKVTQFQYDKLGRLTKVIDAESGETTYGYDELGNRIRQTDANNRSTWFLYDKLGREKARILPDGSQEQKTYNAVGNLETRTDFQNRVTTYGYDLNNRLTTRTYPNAAENVSFTYTLTGRRETATDTRGTTNYGYDNRDRLTTLTQPGAGQLTYAYDNNGNRSTLTATIGANSYATTYTYDDASRLDLVIDPASRNHDHGYDNNGNRTSLQHPNGTTTVYNYNTLNRLTDLTTTGPTGTVFSQVFTLGAAGNREQIVENDGTTKVYGYDNLYRLTTEAVTVGALTQYTKAFTYDPVGNRQTQVTTGSGAAGTPTAPGTITYGYDTRDRLLTENANNLTYDPSGNLTAKVGNATYTWDHENRLTNVTKTDGTVVAYVYDADGNRVSTTTTPNGGSASTTNYLVDTSVRLSHVVAETDGTNSLTTLYIRGIDDLLSVMRPAGGGVWTSKFFHTDGIGSIRRLTDDTGTITDGYSHTAFGEQIGHTGADPQRYSFAGEPLDPNTGFQYHRARWMDPGLARFAGLDPFEGLISRPSTLHRYLYAENSPLNRRDPTGRMTVGESLTVAAIVGTIASMSFAVAHYATSSAPVIVSSEAFILEGPPANWTEADAQSALIGAAHIWMHAAGILVQTRRIRTIPAEKVHLEPFLGAWNGDNQQIVDSLATTNHVTLFVPTLAGAFGKANYGRSPSGRAYSAIASGGLATSAAFVLAHEWGHTFLLGHPQLADIIQPSSAVSQPSTWESLLPFNLMFPDPRLGGVSLTPGQRLTAREFARVY